MKDALSVYWTGPTTLVHTSETEVKKSVTYMPLGHVIPKQGGALVKCGVDPHLGRLQQAARLASAGLGHPQLQRLPGRIAGRPCMEHFCDHFNDTRGFHLSAYNPAVPQAISMLNICSRHGTAYTLDRLRCRLQSPQVPS